MTGNTSSGGSQEPPDENTPDQRLNRRQVAYSLSALIAALVVAAFGIAFAYQTSTTAIRITCMRRIQNLIPTSMSAMASPKT